MDEAAARQHIADRCRAEDDPALTTDELDQLVDKAKVADADGRLPTDPAWVPTWDLDPAIADGWWRKGEKAASSYRTVALGDGISFSRDLYENCIAMAKLYARGEVVIDDDQPTRSAGTIFTSPFAGDRPWSAT